MKPRSFNLLVILALFLSLLGSAVTVTPARAASFTVNTTNDTIDANPGNGSCADSTGNCSLRAAIQEANALIGADTIILPDGLYTLTLGSTLPTVTTTVTINGSEASSTIIEASTCDPITRPDNCTPANYRVLNVSATGNLTIDKVTIRHGQCPNQCIPPIGNGEGGGGIKSFGNLTVINSLITNNSSPNTGGGIYGSGTTQILNSTISNNKAGWVGGGLDIASDTARATIIGSTFLNNFAKAGGGGIEFSQGISSVINSTFSNNGIELYSGGGINNYESTLTVTNSTFSENRAPNGGGISNHLYGTLFLINNVIANSLVLDGSGTTTDCYLNPLDMIGSSINNLIENSQNCGIPLSNSDPILGPLGNYGGPTQTMALLNNSPAIDAGTTTSCPATDQRGVIRPQGAACDIGAYETGPIIPIVTASNPSANAVLTSLSSITVVFNQDMLDNATTDGAENINNYLLVERGTNGSFNTTSCAGGVVSDDVQKTIASANYNSAGFITSLTLASPLTAGTYRLFICGTTSIWSAAGLELNNGASDATVDFTITAAAGTGTTTTTANTSASVLPKTGFTPNKVTTLSAQPANLEYTKLGDLVLEIPSLNVKSTIVGVPQNADKTWDVTWLGNDTGWLNGTAFPTWTGNSVLTAHVTNASGLEGPFAALKQLKYGDQIIVHMGGLKYVYEVRNTRLARPYSTNYAFESKQDAAYLTLITCAGYNPLNESYLFRRVVRAVLIEVK